MIFSGILIVVSLVHLAVSQTSPAETYNFHNADLVSCFRYAPQTGIDVLDKFYGYSITKFSLKPYNKYYEEPRWEVKNNGEEIVQYTNAQPSAALSPQAFYSVDFEVNMKYTNPVEPDDIMGVVFGYESNRKFYVVQWKHRAIHMYNVLGNPGLTIRAVDSTTGPGLDLERALYATNVNDIPPNQLKIIYEEPNHLIWKKNTMYRMKVYHRPAIGLIRVRVYEDGQSNPVIDSHNIIDHTLTRGGLLGPFINSERTTTFSHLRYRAGDTVPGDIYNELCDADKQKVPNRDIPDNNY